MERRIQRTRYGLTTILRFAIARKPDRYILHENEFIMPIHTADQRL